jgi:hypothetical protein
VGGHGDREEVFEDDMGDEVTERILDERKVV